MAEDKNLAGDFVDALHGAHKVDSPVNRRALPPLHPRQKKERWVDTSRTPLEGAGEETNNLFTFPKKALRARYGQYNLALKSDRIQLEEVMNSCLTTPGWILVREEWDTNAEGEKVVTVKYFEPTEARTRAREPRPPVRPIDGSDVDRSDVDADRDPGDLTEM